MDIYLVEALLNGLLLRLVFGFAQEFLKLGIGYASRGLLEDRDGVNVVLRLECLLAGTQLLFDKLTAGNLFLLFLDFGAKIQQRALV